MSAPLLAAKLYIPAPRPNVVLRPRLSARLNEGLHRKLTLISAPAGFGKTTLLSEWVAACQRPAAWLSLDEADNDPHAFWPTSWLRCRRLGPLLEQGWWVSSNPRSHPQPKRF
jgi:LuxR family transcriptional regulator, maltose regulon positive regulatory protein